LAPKMTMRIRLLLKFVVGSFPDPTELILYDSRSNMER
jgi:hypothetical protein